MCNFDILSLSQSSLTSLGNNPHPHKKDIYQRHHCPIRNSSALSARSFSPSHAEIAVGGSELGLQPRRHRLLHQEGGACRDEPRCHLGTVGISMKPLRYFEIPPLHSPSIRKKELEILDISSISINEIEDNPLLW